MFNLTCTFDVAAIINNLFTFLQNLKKGSQPFGCRVLNVEMKHSKQFNNTNNSEIWYEIN